MRISLSDEAIENLESLPKNIQKCVSKKIRFLASQSNPVLFAKKLTNHSLYRFRVGNLRMIFILKENEVLIVSISKRDDVYKRIK